MEKEFESNIPADDLHIVFQPVFLIGKLIALLPQIPIFYKRDNIIRLRWTWIISITTVMVNIVCLACVMNTLSKTPNTNATDLAVTAYEPVYAIMVIFIYIYFLLRYKHLENLLQNWRFLCQQLHFKQMDTTLYSHSCLLSALVLIWGVGEDLMYDARCLTEMQNDPPDGWINMSVLEKYYCSVEVLVEATIPYNSLLALIIFIVHKMSSYAWNYTDVIIIVFCRALGYKFKFLNTLLDKRIESATTEWLPETNTSYLTKSCSVRRQESSPWVNLRKDFLTLCKLLEEMEQFLSPLLFASYCVNVFLICIQLNMWMRPSSETEGGVSFLYWSISFLQYTTRVWLVTHYAASIHSHAHRIVGCLQKCPDKEYSLAVERLERMLLLRPVGITGVGIFFITHKFLLSIFSFIFTFEIILLQTRTTV